MSLFGNIKAILISDLAGKKILAKYYETDTTSDTKKFERQLFVKTRSAAAKDDVFVIDGSLIIHRFISDHHIYVVGSQDENPLVLDSVLNCLAEAMNTLITRNPDSNSLYHNLDQVILVLDEICDEGILLEVDPNLVADRVCHEGRSSEQSLAQVLQSAAEMRFPWIRS